MPNADPPSSRDAIPPFRPIVVGALYPAVERGILADAAAARALDGLAYPVCTQLLMADGHAVTDATDVPEDTVRAQLEHLSASAQPNAIKIGVLANHRAAELVLDYADDADLPVVFDFQISGPTGETVLTSRGIDAVMERLGVPDLVVIGHLDAEPVSGGEIQSLDDAQVAAQRLVRRGARAVLVKCGTLPARHFESSNNGSGKDQSESADSGPAEFNADLYYDGESFALFEAPHLDAGAIHGASSAFSMAVLRALTAGRPVDTALQEAKRYVTEGLRASIASRDVRFSYSWNQSKDA